MKQESLPAEHVYAQILLPNYNSVENTWGLVYQTTLPSAGIYIIEVWTDWFGYSGDNILGIEINGLIISSEVIPVATSSARKIMHNTIYNVKAGDTLSLKMKLPRTRTYEASSENLIRYAKISG